MKGGKHNSKYNINEQTALEKLVGKKVQVISAEGRVFIGNIR